MSNEYPKMLFGKNGWDDLADCQLVADAEQEKAARKAGYAELPSLDAPAAKRSTKAKAPEAE